VQNKETHLLPDLSLLNNSFKQAIKGRRGEERKRRERKREKEKRRIEILLFKVYFILFYFICKFFRYLQ
jgi:hypothetical protein